MKYEISFLQLAHKKSLFHKDEIQESFLCGCFYCLTNFKPEEILEWIDDDKTALCPSCAIDSVIGDKSGFPISDEIFLKEMNIYFFSL